MEPSDVAALVTGHLPGYEVRSLRPLGAGTTSTAYDVNGELVVRVRTGSDEVDVERETTLLGVVAEHVPLPVPRVVFTDADAPAIVVTRLPGVPLMGRPVADLERLAAALGRFVSAVHRVPLDRVAGLVPHDTGPLPEWLDAAADDYRAVEPHLTPAERATIEGFLARPPPDEPPTAVLCHNDLGAEHVLVDPSTGEATGVIDWSDAAVTDPVRDLARLYRDLGPDAYDRLASYYRGTLDTGARERAAFYARCALVEDIAYGLGTAGARRYAAVARTNLARTFA